MKLREFFPPVFVLKLFLFVVYISSIHLLLPDKTFGETTCDAGHLKKGVNLGYFNENTFTTGNSAKCCEKDKNGRDDFAYIRARGFDHVRIIAQFKVDGVNKTISLHPSVKLGNIIDGFIAKDVRVILTVQPTEEKVKDGKTITIPTTLLGDTTFDTNLEKAWQGLAELYSRHESVCFELVHEPDIDDQAWASLQKDIIDAIRPKSNNTIIAVGRRSLMAGLFKLQKLSEPKVIYGFHFYDPYEFTNQGADWSGAAAYEKYLEDVEYPYSPNSVRKAASKIPDLSDRLNATHGMLLATKEEVKDAMDILGEWKKQNGDVICDEFGVIKPIKNPEQHNRWLKDRTRWLKDVGETLTSQGMGWTFYDYSSNNYGIFSANGDFDKNVAKALKLKP